MDELSEIRKKFLKSQDNMWALIGKREGDITRIAAHGASCEEDLLLIKVVCRVVSLELLARLIKQMEGM